MRAERAARRLILRSLLPFVLAACGSTPTEAPHAGCPTEPRTCAETLLVGEDERVTLLVILETDATLSEAELQQQFIDELTTRSIAHDDVIFGRVPGGLELTTDRAGFAAICGSAHVREVDELTPLCPN